MIELEKRIRIRDKIAREYGNRAAWHYETIYLRTKEPIRGRNDTTTNG